MILPYLKDNAIVVFHDVKYHTTSIRSQDAITNDLLMSSIVGKKYLQGNFIKRNNGVCFPNIAGVAISEQTKECIFELFNLLTIKWKYLPTESQEADIISHFERYYDKYYIEYLKDVFLYQKKYFKYNYKYNIKNTIKNIIGQKNIGKIKGILGKI
jgi:hypothetical protein